MMLPTDVAPEPVIVEAANALGAKATDAAVTAIRPTRASFDIFMRTFR